MLNWWLPKTIRSKGLKAAWTKLTIYLGSHSQGLRRGSINFSSKFSCQIRIFQTQIFQTWEQWSRQKPWRLIISRNNRHNSQLRSEGRKVAFKKLMSWTGSVMRSWRKNSNLDPQTCQLQISDHLTI